MANQNPTGTPTAKLGKGKFNTPITFNNAELLQGITDADNDTLRVSLITAEHGEINNNNDTFTFSPDNGFTGLVTLDYVISDDNGGELNAMQTFNISAANQIPTGNATAKLANGKVNTPYSLNAADLLTGFTDTDNDTLRVALVTTENGEIVDNNNGTFTFSPDKDVSGLVTLNYVIGDDNGGEISATQSFSLTADTTSDSSLTPSINNAPTGSATAKLVNGKVNTTYLLNHANLLEGFTDADNGTLRISLITADNGEITDNNNGTFIFSPDKDVSGLVTLNYVISDDKGGEISATQKFSIGDTPAVIIPKINTPHTGDVSIVSQDKAGVFMQNQTLILNNTLADADGLGEFNYQWLQNGALISGATQETYIPTESDIGKTIKVKVSYTDGGNTLETVTSKATDIIQPFYDPDSVALEPKYTLTVDRQNVNESETIYLHLETKNIAEGTEIPFKLSGTISNADALGNLPIPIFYVESDGSATVAVGFKNDKLTEGAETLIATLSNDVKQTVTVTVAAVKTDNSTPTPPKIKINGKTEQGDSSNNLIIGAGKNDKLSGMAGADTLRGNAGNDLLDGGAGDDALDGGNGNDNLMGNAGNDTLEGGAGKDTLNGGAGVDSMTGGDGDDYYVVDNSKDRVIETNKSVILGGKDTVKATSSYTLGENIENLILDDAEGKGFNGTGNKSDNIITGNIGDDTLNGMAGNDKLDAGEGDDTLDGGLGIDTLIGGNGSDVYYMNNLEDKIIEIEDGGDQDQIIAKVNFNLTQSENVEVLTLSGSKAKEGDGNELNNLLQEEANGKTNNLFNGNGGDDVIYGQGGNDTLEGGEGNDELDGGDGKDTAVFTGSSEDYQITRNIDVEGVAQLIIEYKGNDETILEGRDILTNVEILQFAEGETINTNTFLVLTGSTTDA